MNNNGVFKNLIISTFICVFCCFKCFGQAPSINYNQPNPFTVGVAIPVLKPTATGVVTLYSISPALPDGIQIDPASGVITGIPKNASPQTEYSIIATNKTLPSIPFKIKITVNAAPLSITYTPSNTYIVGVPITDLTPSTINGSATKYSINPGLPTGLSLNPASGIISGTPAVVSAVTEYTIIATDEKASSQPTKIKIAVNPAASTTSSATYFSMAVVFIFCLAILYFLLDVTYRSRKNEKEALGLPRGSVRAIIAILFVVFFALLAVVFYFDSDVNARSTDLAKQILTILGTLVTAVSAFYFGAKATEQGHQIATEAFQTNLDQANQQGSQQNFNTLSDSDQDAVLSATIQSYYNNWKVQYPNINSCNAGFKTTGNQRQSQKALVFGVGVKKKPAELNASDIIPPQIYANGYWLPTDVVQQNRASAQATINYPGDNYTPSRIGTNVSLNTLDANGSVSLKVRSTSSTDIYLLSCFHVLCFDQISDTMFQDGPEVCFEPDLEADTSLVTIPSKFYRESNGVAINMQGKLKQGVYSPMMDAAVAVINDQDLENTTFDGNGINEIEVTTPTTLDQLSIGDTVVSYGCVSGMSSGQIKLVKTGNFDLDVQGPNCLIDKTFTQMIMTDCISVDGDSGAPVFTTDGRFVGIILGGDGVSTSFILPFQYIVNRFNINL